MYSKHKKGESDVTERCVKTLKIIKTKTCILIN